MVEDLEFVYGRPFFTLYGRLYELHGDGLTLSFQDYLEQGPWLHDMDLGWLSEHVFVLGRLSEDCFKRLCSED